MTGKAEPSTAFDGPGRIDVHHHCFPGTLEELQSEFEHNSYNLNYSPFPQGPEEHLEYMDRVGIQTAVIVSDDPTASVIKYTMRECPCLYSPSGT